VDRSARDAKVRRLRSGLKSGLRLFVHQIRSSSNLGNSPAPPLPSCEPTSRLFVCHGSVAG
jgi:hypothetical protein